MSKITDLYPRFIGIYQNTGRIVENVRFEVFTAVTMKNDDFWDVIRRVALVRTDISEEHSASFIRVTRIDELGTTQAATSKQRASAASCSLCCS
jgi:hypothetical protein